MPGTSILGFHLVNLIVPDEPVNFTITGIDGNWDIRQHPYFKANRKAINSRVHCDETHIADHVDLRDKEDEILDEIKHLCLTFSYLTSNAVTVNRTAIYSRYSFIQVGDGFPREKGISGINPIVNNQADFMNASNKMILLFNKNIADYHFDIIIHYWLDILSGWSLENLFLGACTILEIIKQSEIRRTGIASMYFHDAIVSVSSHLGITTLNRDWINMRNDLIHEGHLSKLRFPNKTKFECIEVCEDVMSWIDEFIHAIFQLGSVKQPRFIRGSLTGINSYTTDN